MRESGVLGTKIWRVVFADGYRSAKILDHDNNAIVENFTLMN